MFKRRSLQVKLIKDKKETPQITQKDTHLEGKVAIIGHHLERIVVRVGVVLVAYVVVDTIRQVVVAETTK